MNKPVKERIEKLDKAIKAIIADEQKIAVDFSNTEIAFASKTNEELKQMARMFALMNQQWLVNIGSKLTLLALRLRVPFVETIIKKTIFKQFVGGASLYESEDAIDRLLSYNAAAILDYGVEGKESEQDFNQTMNENIRAIEFAARNNNIPVVSTKITGLARFKLLEMLSEGNGLEKSMEAEYQNVLKRVDTICAMAHQKKVKVFIDAEESWIQPAIDQLVDKMMERYNKTHVTVYNTFQMYRHDRLPFLMESYETAKRNGYMLGAKLVRGAYMEKERIRALQQGYPSPIHPNKAATDQAFNEGIAFVVEHYEDIASCNASHNAKSAFLQAELIAQKNIIRKHPHLNFCQLYGMSDQLTFNLAQAGYNVAKYVPYGPVKEVMPYLIRRAQENVSVTGDMSREYQSILTELKRRGVR